MEKDRRAYWLKVLRVGVAIAAILVGGVVVLVTAALGHCSAFGGRCPSPSSFDGDVFRGAAMGAALAVGVPLWMQRPSWRGFVRAAATAVLVAVPVGALVMAATRG